MILIHTIKTAHIRSRGRAKRKCYITATRINRKGDAGTLVLRVPSVMKFLTGRNRQTSIELGFQVDVCPEIHARLHASADPWAKVENKKWRMFFQAKHEEELIASGMTEKEARAEWMRLIGKNYL